MKQTNVDGTRKIPFIRIFIPFLIGLLLEEKIGLSLLCVLSILGTSIIIIIFLNTFNTNWRWRFKFFTGSMTILLMILLGMICKAGIKAKGDKSYQIKSGVHIVKLITINNQSNKVLTAEAEIYLQIKKTWKYKSMISVHVNSNENMSFHEGDIFLAFIEPKQSKSFSSPTEPDYGFRQKIKGIYLEAYISQAPLISKVGHEKNKLLVTIQKIREKTLHIIKKSFSDKKTYGIAEAMLIGYREDLDNELLSSYVNTGVVHVIAISGMHLSLIFLIIDLVIGILFKKNRKDFIGLFVTIPTLWLFSMVTGSSASVIRSALMLTFILISKAFSKNSNGMNALLGSAFMLTVWSPWLIFDIGFQLSYFAVGSMMIFEDKIRKLIYVKNFFLSKGWEMISVTLAAQILTTPISIYHFHQFPVLFLFTNIIAVPLSSIILLGEICMCATDLFHMPHSIIDSSIAGCISFLNVYIEKMEHVKYGVISNIHLGEYSTLIIYVVIFFVTFISFKKSLLNLFFIISILTIFSLVYYEERKSKFLDDFIVISGKKNKPVCIIKIHDKVILLCNDDFLQNNIRIKKISQYLRNKYWTKDIRIINLHSNPSILNIRKKSTNLHIGIITNNAPAFGLLDQLKRKKMNHIIADGTNKLWKSSIWQTDADRLTLRFHSVSEKGPFILPLSH